MYLTIALWIHALEWKVGPSAVFPMQHYFMI